MRGASGLLCGFRPGLRRQRPKVLATFATDAAESLGDFRYRTPLLLATPDRRGSAATAIRKLRAIDLNTASAM